MSIAGVNYIYASCGERSKFNYEAIDSCVLENDNVTICTCSRNLCNSSEKRLPFLFNYIILMFFLNVFYSLKFFAN